MLAIINIEPRTLLAVIEMAQVDRDLGKGELRFKVDDPFENDDDQTRIVISNDDKTCADEPEGSLNEKESETKLPVWSIVARVLGVLLLLYFFVCSLDLMGSAFKLLGGKEAGKVFSQNKIISNPVAGLMVGVLVTVLLQSSSTSSSLVVAMVAGGMLQVEMAVPIIMGANIGTSVTNTIVAISQIQDSGMYERAFAAATVHDMFNILTMSILLPVEWITHCLSALSKLIVDMLPMGQNENADVELLSRFTDPFTDLIVVVNKTYIKEISKGHTVGDDEQVLQRYCDDDLKERCDSLFSQFNFSDKAAGAILLTLSLLIMFACLILMVKLLKSIFHGHISKVINKTVNAGFPGKLNFLTGYVAIIVGAIMTVLVQSSSIFTSTLTPLVGLNIITLERAFPLTLGSNIGTTVTSMLAALASDGDFAAAQAALQISFCHLMFNVIGILIWYPIPAMRQVPLGGARQLGKTTSKYKWFAFAYVAFVFLVIPGIIFGLSMLGTIYVIIFCSFILFTAILVAVLKLLQKYSPNCLPAKLRDFKFLPKWMRSLQPVHDLGLTCVNKVKRKKRSHGGAITRRRTTTESSQHLTADADQEIDGAPKQWNEDRNDRDRINSSLMRKLIDERIALDERNMIKGKEMSPDDCEGKIHLGKEATEQMGNDSGVPSSNSSSSSKCDVYVVHISSV